MDVTGGVVVLLLSAAVLIGSRLNRRNRSAKRDDHSWRSHERCTIRVGRALLPLAAPSHGALLLRVIPLLRLRWAERGLSFPSTHFSDDLRLPENEYVLSVDGKEILRAELRYQKILVVNPRESELPEGDRVDFDGRPAVWTEQSERSAAEAAGALVLEPEEVFRAHLTTLARSHLHLLEDWSQLFKQPNADTLERFREQVIARLEAGGSVYPIEHFAEWHEQHGCTDCYEPPTDQFSKDMAAALIYQNLAQFLKESINKRLTPFQLERLSVALMTLWDLNEEAREMVIRRARFWNLNDNDEAVSAVVQLLSSGAETRGVQTPMRRLALLVSGLEEPSRSEILSLVRPQLDAGDLAGLAMELANVPTCSPASVASLSDPIEEERGFILRSLVESLRRRAHGPPAEPLLAECRRLCSLDVESTAIWIRHIWFLEDPLDFFRHFAWKHPARLARRVLSFVQQEPEAALRGPEKLAIFLSMLPAALARRLRAAVSRLSLPPERSLDVSEEKRLRVAQEFASRARGLASAPISPN